MYLVEAEAESVCKEDMPSTDQTVKCLVPPVPEVTGEL